MDFGFIDPRLAAAGPAEADDLRPLGWRELCDRLAARHAAGTGGEARPPASFYPLDYYPMTTQEHGGGVVNPNRSVNGKADRGRWGPAAADNTANPDEPSFFE